MLSNNHPEDMAEPPPQNTNSSPPAMIHRTSHGHTVRTGIIGPRARTSELPLLVRSGSFFFLFCLRLGLRRSVFAVRSPPYPREGISDFKVSGPIIPVLTVQYSNMARTPSWILVLIRGLRFASLLQFRSANCRDSRTIGRYK